ncbi:hypothetical protein PN471_01285 [Aphanizomenon sp. CS-733/32]|uniref:hypothetical protein n=1 Tax=Aphanizomenon sp. CS-733/32 TaxID=3021715 RepID=UPI0023300A8B|nr:hypothetical protein [Aphanizomenon sp. CS-733/32]MDB9307311.1 hypothetical protein [Aphanizomenon sp. CS-733/32]
MSQRRVQIVILCEDKQQEVFAMHFLQKRGFTLDRNFRTEICPKGAGEQFVREKYAKEVVEYRRQRNNRSGIFINSHFLRIYGFNIEIEAVLLFIINKCQFTLTPISIPSLFNCPSSM